MRLRGVISTVLHAISAQPKKNTSETKKLLRHYMVHTLTTRNRWIWNGSYPNQNYPKIFQDDFVGYWTAVSLIIFKKGSVFLDLILNAYGRQGGRNALLHSLKAGKTSVSCWEERNSKWIRDSYKILILSKIDTISWDSVFVRERVNGFWKVLIKLHKKERGFIICFWLWRNVVLK